MAHDDLKSIVFNEAIFEMADADGVDLDGSTHTFLARLCRVENGVNSHPGHHADAGAEHNTNIRKDRMDDFVLLDHVFAGTVGVDDHAYLATDGHSTRDDQVLTGVSIAKVVTGDNNYIEFKAEETTWLQVDGSVNAAGVLIYRRAGANITAADDIPICFIKFTAEIDPDKSDLTVKWGGTATDALSGPILKLQQG